MIVFKSVFIIVTLEHGIEYTLSAITLPSLTDKLERWIKLLTQKIKRKRIRKKENRNLNIYVKLFIMCFCGGFNKY